MMLSPGFYPWVALFYQLVYIDKTEADRFA